MAKIDRLIIQKILTKYLQDAMGQPKDKVVIETITLMLLTKLGSNLGGDELTVATALKTLDKLIEKAREIKKGLEEEYERVNT